MQRTRLLLLLLLGSVFHCDCLYAGEQAIAICIGMGRVNQDAWGSDYRCETCQQDARRMRSIAVSNRFKPTLLLNSDATVQGVRNALESARTNLNDDGILMLTFSGHGGQRKDENHDEDDELDETWYLYDNELVDDEIYTLLGRFHKNVRIVVFSDSCHSGSVIKIFDKDPLGERRKDKADVENMPYVQLFAACPDAKTASEGRNGNLSVFTAAVNSVWRSSNTYTNLATNLVQEVHKTHPNQHVQHSWMNDRVSQPFEGQRPFTPTAP